MNIQRSPIRGMHGWVIVALVILVIDLLAKPNETLTACAHRALKRKPITVVGLVLVTSLHLTAGSGPYQKLDPFKVVELIRALTGANRDTGLSARF